ncbi:MAG: choice-of-anchor D domain-containing protein [Nitrospirota bacterium]
MAKDGLIKVIEGAINDDANFKLKKEEKKMFTKGILRMVLGMVFVVVLAMGCNSGGSNPAGPSGDTGAVADSGSGSGSGSGSDTTPTPPATPPPSTPSVPVAYMTPDHIDFGSVLIGSKKTESVIIENKGTATLNIISAVTGSDWGGTFNATGVCDSIPPGASCEYKVRFEPPTVGNLTGYFKITTNDPVNAILKTTLSGYGKIILIPPKF